MRLFRNKEDLETIKQLDEALNYLLEESRKKDKYIEKLEKMVKKTQPKGTTENKATKKGKAKVEKEK